MVCPNCGNNLNDTDVVCPFCGNAVNNVNSAMQANPVNPPVGNFNNINPTAMPNNQMGMPGTQPMMQGVQPNMQTVPQQGMGAQPMGMSTIQFIKII